MACTSHGPVLTSGCMLEYVLDKYAEWSCPVENGKISIPIFFCSAYGNTGLIAQEIRNGILETIPDAECEIYDINEHPMSELQYKLNTSSAFAVGSPTINGDAVAPVWNLLSHVDAINNKKKPVLVFGSYGWSGEAIPNLTARLTGLKMTVYSDAVKVQFVPSEADFENARATGKSFAGQLR